MAKKFSGKHLDMAVRQANVMYHEGNETVAEIARQLRCSWSSADKLIVYSRDKWEQRQELSRPPRVDERIAY